MRFGKLTLTTISGGRYRADGGTMFGVVPKALWNRVLPADDKNRIPLATNCLLVRSKDYLALIDTGYGSKFSDKGLRLIDGESGDPLARSLAEQGVTYGDIDFVILTHLHFDHAGGTTRRDEDGRLVDSFPRAEYIVQKREWNDATAQTPELVAAYPLENITPLGETGRLRLVEGDVEIVPGIRALVTGGHTHGHQAFVIESEGQGAIYLSDLCSTSRHMPMNWCLSFDVDLLHTRTKKREVLGQIADAGWLALWVHDPDHAAARLARTKSGDIEIVESIVAL